MIKQRRVFQEPWWALLIVGEVYAFKLSYDRRAACLGLASIPVAHATAACLFELWGALEVAERYLHDLCLAVRTYQHALPRLRMFATFIGGGWELDMDPATAALMRTEHAVSRYLDLVVALHGAGTGELEDEGECNDKPEEGLAHGILAEMFPSSFDPIVRQDKKDMWYVSSARVNGAAARWATKQSGVSPQLVVEAIGKLREDAEGRVDADEALWALMMTWAKSMTMLTKGCSEGLAPKESTRGRRSLRSGGGSGRSSRSGNLTSSFLVLSTPSSGRVPPLAAAQLRRHDPDAEPLPNFTWTSLSGAVLSVIKPDAAGGAGTPKIPGAKGPISGNELDDHYLAAAYLKMACQRGTAPAKAMSSFPFETVVGPTTLAPLEPILRDCVLWNSNTALTHVPSELPQNADEEEWMQAEVRTLPRRLLLRVVRGGSLVGRQLLFRRAWAAYREPLEKAVDEVSENLTHFRSYLVFVSDAIPCCCDIDNAVPCSCRPRDVRPQRSKRAASEAAKMPSAK